MDVTPVQDVEDKILFTKLCIGSLLGISTFIDIKTRSVSFKVLLAYGILGVFNIFLFDKQNLLTALSGAFIGVIILVLSKLTRGGIGMGDGLLLIVTGLFLGIWKNTELLLGSFFLAALFSIVLLIAKKADRKKEIPFIPFLLLSFLGLVLL